jgi:peptidoglycan/xylan/chitin deacetylase (PgdA/CDA1 family)
MIRRAKLGALKAARALGFNSVALRSRWRRNRLMLFAWHGFSIDDEHQWNSRLYVPAALLRRRLELIAEARCNVLPLDTAVRLLYRGELPPRSVALTVDDGTFDFYSVAYPMFQRFGFPVTVYLTTYYANFNRPVFDVMGSYLMWKGRDRVLRWPEVLGEEARELRGPAIEDAAARLRQYAAAHELSGADKDALLSRLAERLNLDYAPMLHSRMLHLMTIGEARELAGRGVDFQLHTHRHGLSLDKEVFLRELADNRAWLRRIRADEAAHFCYPAGLYRTEFLPWLREAGIASATTCQTGIANRRADPMLLPRLVDHCGVTEDEFAAWLSGFAASLPIRTWHSRGQLLEQRQAKPKTAATAAGR